MLQHWKTQTGLGPWAGWEAWLQACTHSRHLGMGCSQVRHLGLALSALFGEVFLSMPILRYCECMKICRFQAKKPVSGAFYSRGSRLVKFPWQSLNFWNPQECGQSCTPILCSQFSTFCPNHQKNCLKFFVCDRGLNHYWDQNAISDYQRTQQSMLYMQRCLSASEQSGSFEGLECVVHAHASLPTCLCVGVGVGL